MAASPGRTPPMARACRYARLPAGRGRRGCHLCLAFVRERRRVAPMAALEAEIRGGRADGLGGSVVATRIGTGTLIAIFRIDRRQAVAPGRLGFASRGPRAILDASRPLVPRRPCKRVSPGVRFFLGKSISEAIGSISMNQYYGEANGELDSTGSPVSAQGRRDHACLLAAVPSAAADQLAGLRKKPGREYHGEAGSRRRDQHCCAGSAFVSARRHGLHEDRRRLSQKATGVTITVLQRDPMTTFQPKAGPRTNEYRGRASTCVWGLYSCRSCSRPEVHGRLPAIAETILRQRRTARSWKAESPATGHGNAANGADGSAFSRCDRRSRRGHRVAAAEKGRPPDAFPRRSRWLPGSCSSGMSENSTPAALALRPRFEADANGCVVRWAL